jgi:hypothetical protein
MTEAKIAIDGTELRDILDLVGAPSEPTAATRQRVAELEEWLGKPLPSETRDFLLTPIALAHPDADHPEVVEDFIGALPDVDRWISGLAEPFQGRFNATMHFLGLYPIGVQLQYGDFMFALAILEPHTGTRLGGVMYYDEREVGTWGASISEFLLRAMAEFWEQVDGEVEEDEGEDLDLDDLRDCFILEGYDYKHKPAGAAELPAPVSAAFERHWRARLEQRSRWWINSFVAGNLARHELDEVPTRALWESERDRVATTHHDAMYWLIAHLLLDNRDELGECIAMARKNPSKIVQAVVEHLVANPELGARWGEQRQALYELAREALDH